MRTYRLEVKKGRNKRWYMHLMAPNGRIVLDGAQGYASKGACRRAAVRLFAVFEGHRVSLLVPE